MRLSRAATARAAHALAALHAKGMLAMLPQLGTTKKFQLLGLRSARQYMDQRSRDHRNMDRM